MRIKMIFKLNTHLYIYIYHYIYTIIYIYISNVNKHQYNYLLRTLTLLPSIFIFFCPPFAGTSWSSCPVVSFSEMQRESRRSFRGRWPKGSPNIADRQRFTLLRLAQASKIYQAEQNAPFWETVKLSEGI